MGRPRYLNGSTSSLQFRKVLAIPKNIGETLTPIIPLFQKFTLRLDAISNPLRIALRAQMFSTEASPIHSVSFAYWRCEITTGFLPTEKPLKISKSTAFLITPLNPSTTNKKRNGARGSPCLRPLCILISGVGDPLEKKKTILMNQPIF
jgi:hypothetical protein